MSSLPTDTEARPDGGSPPPTAPDPGVRGPRGLALVALVAGLVSVLAALAFPFAPVTRPDVTYSWPAPGSSSPAPAAS